MRCSRRLTRSLSTGASRNSTLIPSNLVHPDTLPSATNHSELAQQEAMHKVAAHSRGISAPFPWLYFSSRKPAQKRQGQPRRQLRLSSARPRATFELFPGQGGGQPIPAPKAGRVHIQTFPRHAEECPVAP